MKPKNGPSTTVSPSSQDRSETPHNIYRAPKTSLRPLPVFAADGSIEKDGQGNEIYQWHKRGPNGEWILIAVGPLPK
jgi:hypothetical protein